MKQWGIESTASLLVRLHYNEQSQLTLQKCLHQNVKRGSIFINNIFFLKKGVIKQKIIIKYISPHSNSFIIILIYYCFINRFPHFIRHFCHCITLKYEYWNKNKLLNTSERSVLGLYPWKNETQLPSIAFFSCSFMALWVLIKIWFVENKNLETKLLKLEIQNHIYELLLRLNGIFREKIVIFLFFWNLKNKNTMQCQKSHNPLRFAIIAWNQFQTSIIHKRFIKRFIKMKYEMKILECFHFSFSKV